MDERKGFLSRRVTLKGWQKLLLVLGCTVLAAAASWLYCEKIASPVYTSSVRAQSRRGGPTWSAKSRCGPSASRTSREEAAKTAAAVPKEPSRACPAAGM